jgi:precorrin-6B methylase 2
MGRWQLADLLLVGAAVAQHSLGDKYTKYIPIEINNKASFNLFNFTVSLHGSGWYCAPASSNASFCDITGTTREFCVSNDIIPVEACVANMDLQIHKQTMNIKYELFGDLGDYLAEKGTKPEDIEGHSGFYLEKSKLMHSLAADNRVSTICEIGFNAGHSALGWLVANPNAFVFAFDIGFHAYTAHALDFILERFPGRVLLTIGTSLDTIRTWSRMHSAEHKCNLLFVDGGHTEEVAREDVLNMRAMANESYHRLIVDDTQMEEVVAAWQHLQREGVVKEMQVVEDVFAQCAEEDVQLGGWKECTDNPRIPWMDSSITVAQYLVVPQEVEQEL